MEQLVEKKIIDDKYKQIEEDMMSLLDGFIIIKDLVSDQQEQIDSIENFIEESKTKVKEGHKELVQAEEYVKSNSYLNYIIGVSATVGAGIIYLIL
jgi:t-SNARE complex subunit (syntaxin)